MTTLKTLLPRRAMSPDESPAVDLPPGLHRFLKEWERQLLKSDKPPHREVAKVLKLKDSTVSTYKLRLIDLGVLVKIGPCRYKIPDDLVVNMVGQPKMPGRSSWASRLSGLVMSMPRDWISSRAPS